MRSKPATTAWKRSAASPQMSWVPLIFCGPLLIAAPWHFLPALQTAAFALRRHPGLAFGFRVGVGEDALADMADRPAELVIDPDLDAGVAQFGEEGGILAHPGVGAGVELAVERRPARPADAFLDMLFDRMEDGHVDETEAEAEHRHFLDDALLGFLRRRPELLELAFFVEAGRGRAGRL